MGLNPGYYFRSFLLNLHFYLAYIKTDSKAPSVGTLFTWPKLAFVGIFFFKIFQDLKAEPFSISLKTNLVYPHKISTLSAHSLIFQPIRISVSAAFRQTAL